MEIRALARAVLYGARLQDKLLDADTPLTDAKPGPALTEAPSAPGRPRKLTLGGGRRRSRFPGPGQLANPVARGRALHFFANHELLAMELMALALLKFPTAPPGFRRGVAHTLREEQAHLRRYQARMAELGVDLGDVPVSDFFWSTMADMATPLDYVVRMSLTFEQANLDHARHYGALFRQAGDEQTAELMDLVFEEELGHVQHGVTWFNRWRQDGAPDPNESDWHAYQRLLPEPLTARRAKGQPYFFDARRRVGLSETFARELEIYSHTRGRPPTVWLFEPDFEAQHEGTETSPVTRAIAADLAAVLMFVAASDDVVATPVRPTAAVLTPLARAGFEVPELLVADPVHARPPWARARSATCRVGATAAPSENFGTAALCPVKAACPTLRLPQKYGPPTSSLRSSSRIRAGDRSWGRAASSARPAGISMRSRRRANDAWRRGTTSFY